MEDLNSFTDETTTLTNSFITQFADFELQKKNIQSEVKELKKMYEEQGLPTKEVVRAYNLVKKEIKNADKMNEIELFKDVLYKNEKLKEQIQELLAK